MTLAKLNHWWCHHVYDSRRSAAGLPDLLCVKPGRAFWAELKAQRGKLSLQQVIVIDLLRQAGQTVFVWRPSDWDEVVKTLEAA